MTDLPHTGVTGEQADAAPFATRQPVDLSTRVSKVQRPVGGDFACSHDTAVHGSSSYFVWLSRPKESLTLDLQDSGCQEALESLSAWADRLVPNLAPGTAGLDMDAASLSRRHLSPIPCMISGHDTTGPRSSSRTAS